MTIFHDEAHYSEICLQKWESVCMRPEGLCHCESEPKTKGGFGAVFPVGTIVFSSEILSPRAQEQLRQMFSKVKWTDNAGNSREPSGKFPRCFRHHRENWQQPKEIEAIWWEQSHSIPEQFLWFQRSSSSTVVCAANLPQIWPDRWLS